MQDFNNTKNCLNNMVNAIERINHGEEYSEEIKNTIEFFELHLVESLMQDNVDIKRLARILEAIRL